MVISGTVLAPRSVPFADWALMNVLAIALAQCCNIGVTTQKILARLASNRVAMLRLH
jgi:hypothetical protein